jgi:hypothetical protein
MSGSSGGDDDDDDVSDDEDAPLPGELDDEDSEESAQEPSGAAESSDEEEDADMEEGALSGSRAAGTATAGARVGQPDEEAFGDEEGKNSVHPARHDMLPCQPLGVM